MLQHEKNEVRFHEFSKWAKNLDVQGGQFENILHGMINMSIGNLLSTMKPKICFKLQVNASRYEYQFTSGFFNGWNMCPNTFLSKHPTSSS
jgi:hypothetical protein